MNGSLQAKKSKVNNSNNAPNSGPQWKKISLRLHFQSANVAVVVEAYDTTVQFPSSFLLCSMSLIIFRTQARLKWIGLVYCKSRRVEEYLNSKSKVIE